MDGAGHEYRFVVILSPYVGCDGTSISCDDGLYLLCLCSPLEIIKSIQFNPIKSSFVTKRSCNVIKSENSRNDNSITVSIHNLFIVSNVSENQS